jgi:hypothetical protein
MTRQIQDIAKPHLPAGPWVSTFALRTQKGVVLRLLESRALVPSRFPDKVIHFPMPKGLPNRKGEAARRIELYSSAYKLAWEQISSAERRAHPDISLRIHASIRRQLKQGEMDPRRIAFAAIKDSLVPDTPE